MDKASDYLDEAKKLTRTLAGVLDQQQKVLQQDLDLKKAETRRIEIEIKRIEDAHPAISTKKEQRKSTGRKLK